MYTYFFILLSSIRFEARAFEWQSEHAEGFLVAALLGMTGRGEILRCAQDDRGGQCRPEGGATRRGIPRLASLASFGKLRTGGMTISGRMATFKWQASTQKGQPGLAHGLLRTFPARPFGREASTQGGLYAWRHGGSDLRFGGCVPTGKAVLASSWGAKAPPIVSSSCIMEVRLATLTASCRGEGEDDGWL